MQLRFFKCNWFCFWVFCCEVSNYFLSGYDQDDQDNQECYYQVDMFLISETIIVRLFQRNQYCYCDYFIRIVFIQVRLRLGCNLYISCIMSCGNKKIKISQRHLSMTITYCSIYRVVERLRVQSKPDVVVAYLARSKILVGTLLTKTLLPENHLSGCILTVSVHLLNKLP